MKETSTLEFKETVTNTFLKTVSAFANYNGGKILFGVKDDGTESGLVDPKQTCLNIENKINDSIRPQPNYTLDIKEPESLVVLTVKPGLNTPYTYKSKAYRRNDTATIEVDNLELSRLILKGRNLHFEELPADNQNLTFSILAQKAKSAIGIEHFNQDTLKTLNLYSDADGYNHAAELVADSNNFPGIDIAKFGDSINIIQRRVTLDHHSILQEFDEAIQLYKDYYQYEEIQGASRVQKELIPEEAFREALANALIHRTWDISSQIRVFMYDSKIEILSPGGLPAGISEEEYLRGNVSVLRNPILGNLFYRLHIVEILGTGILRILDSYQNVSQQPQFEFSNNSIKVVLPVIQNTQLTEDENAVWNALSPNITQSITELAEKLPFGRSKITALLNTLIDNGYVIKEGRGRGTKYRRS